MFEQKIGFIGPGKMAKAIVSGIITTSFAHSDNIYIYGRSPESLAYFAEMGCFICSDLQEMTENCTVIFLCIKPQSFPAVLGELKPLVSDKILFVSIAAGLTSETIYEMLGGTVRFVRAMPNTPLLLGKGATALSPGIDVSEADLALVESVFSSCGVVGRITEPLMDAVINVNGSTPAYLYLFAKCIGDVAVAQGIDRATARLLFAQTLIGTGEMLRQLSNSEDELIAMVASKGGTTQAALAVLDGPLQSLLVAAMEACFLRAKELGK